MKLSIIIPVYNVELYVEKCLLSCLKQDVSSDVYEIIVVNDGSPDSSLQIVERLASVYKNITIVSQLNSGLSAARNKGLSLAKGEYIWFVDSDDWIEENCLGYLLSLCNGVDIVAISHAIIENKIIKLCCVKESKTGIELLIDGFFHPAQFYIMRKSFVEYYNLRFMAGVFHEDLEFTPRMLYFANSLVSSSRCVYNYLHRPASIMTTINSKRAFDLIKVISSLYKFKNEKVEKVYWNIYENLIALGFNNALYIISQSGREDQKQWIITIKEKMFLLKELIYSPKLKNKIEGIVFILFPDKTINCYRLSQRIKTIIGNLVRSNKIMQKN